MEQQQFQDNVSEWIKIMNVTFKELKEDYEDLLLATEEDLSTLSYQYQIIKDLRKRVFRLERELYSLKGVTPSKERVTGELLP